MSIKSILAAGAAAAMLATPVGAQAERPAVVPPVIADTPAAPLADPAARGALPEGPDAGAEPATRPPVALPPVALCARKARAAERGERGAEMRRCVAALTRLAESDTPSLNPRAACRRLSRKRVRGQRGTPFSRCVKAAARLLRERAAAEEADTAEEAAENKTEVGAPPAGNAGGEQAPANG
jgi:hypothetical protein